MCCPPLSGSNNAVFYFIITTLKAFLSIGCPLLVEKVNCHATKQFSQIDVIEAIWANYLQVAPLAQRPQDLITHLYTNNTFAMHKDFVIKVDIYDILRKQLYMGYITKLNKKEVNKKVSITTVTTSPLTFSVILLIGCLPMHISPVSFTNV